MAESVEHPMVVNWPAGVGRSPSIDGERVLWGFLVVVMALDVWTTMLGIQHGLSEGNQLVRAAIAAFGISGLVLIKGIVLAIAAGLAMVIPDRATPVIPLGLALPTMMAVAVNIAFVAMAG